VLLLRDRLSSVAGRVWRTQTIALPRGRCRFKWFRLAAVPAAERLSALRIQALGWQPFQSTDYGLVLQGGEGLAIAWDGALAAEELAAAGHAAGRARLVPETLLRAPQNDGVMLVRCGEGVEGQVWRAGALVASRWWAAPPVEDEWRLFLHAGAATPEELASPLPSQAVDLPLLDKPWTSVHGINDSADAQVARLEKRALAAGALVLLVGIGTVARQEWDVWQELRQRRADMAELRESAASALSSRDQALAQIERVGKFAAILNEPLPLEVLSHVHDMLGKSGVLIREFELTGNKLRLGLQLGPQVSRTTLVRDLQAGGWFQDVAEERQGNQSNQGYAVLRMSLSGLHPAAAAPTTVAAEPAAPPPPPGGQATSPTPASPTATTAPTAAPPAPVATATPAPPRATPKPLQLPAGMASGPLPDKLPQSIFDSIETSK
jgi:hypothetical protein